MKIAELLDTIYKVDQPLHIIETGCLHTREIAKWAAEHPGVRFESVDVDGRLQEATHSELECDGTAKYCTFRTQSPFRHLAAQSWIDVAFLRPDDLAGGVDLFDLALSAGAATVIIKDFQARAAFAVRRAKQLGWDCENDGEYCILRRPI